MTMMVMTKDICSNTMMLQVQYMKFLMDNSLMAKLADNVAVHVTMDR